MELAKTEEITIDGPDMLQHMQEYLRSLPTLSEDDVKSTVSEMTRRFRQASSSSSAKPKARRERVPLDSPTGLNRAQRRALARARKNR